MRKALAVVFVLGLTAWASTAWCQLATVDFLAGKTVDVGNVEVGIADGDGDGYADDLCALVTMENDWELTEVHYMAWVVDPAGMQPVPGKWPVAEYAPPASDSGLLLLVPDVTPGTYYVAVQGEVQLEIWTDLDQDGEVDEGEVTIQYESAWGAGNRFRTARKGWWPTYFSVVVPEP